MDQDGEGGKGVILEKLVIVQQPCSDPDLAVVLGRLRGSGTELQPWSLPRKFRLLDVLRTPTLALLQAELVGRVRTTSPVLLSAQGLCREHFPELGSV